MVINWEIFLRKRGLCIHKFKNNTLPLGEVCTNCVNLIIGRFGGDFLTNI